MQVVEACLATRAVNGGLLELGSLRRYVSVRAQLHLMLHTVLLTVHALFYQEIRHVSCCSCKEPPRQLSSSGAAVQSLSEAGVRQGRTCTRSPWPARRSTFHVL